MLYADVMRQQVCLIVGAKHRSENVLRMRSATNADPMNRVDIRTIGPSMGSGISGTGTAGLRVRYGP